MIEKNSLVANCSMLSEGIHADVVELRWLCSSSALCTSTQACHCDHVSQHSSSLTPARPSHVNVAQKALVSFCMCCQTKVAMGPEYLAHTSDWCDKSVELNTPKTHESYSAPAERTIKLVQNAKLVRSSGIKYAPVTAFSWSTG